MKDNFYPAAAVAVISIVGITICFKALTLIADVTAPISLFSPLIITSGGPVSLAIFRGKVGNILQQFHPPCDRYTAKNDDYMAQLGVLQKISRGPNRPTPPPGPPYPQSPGPPMYPDLQNRFKRLKPSHVLL